MISKNLLVVLIFVLLIGNVSALGITPARNTLEFEPSLESQASFRIINSENKDMEIKIYTQGDLSQNIVIKEESFSMDRNQNEKKVEYGIRLPENLAPGLHTGEIVIMEVPKGAEGEMRVGATLAVIKQIHVYSPYPGKYTEVALNVYGTDKKTFAISFMSRGQENINEIYSEVEIYDSEGKLLKTLKTNKDFLSKGTRKELIVEWTPEFPVGRYLARAIAHYDGERNFVETEFEIGERILDLQRIYVEDFSLGEIAKFNMIVENKWNEPMVGAFAEFRIYNQEMREIANLKTANYDIPAGTQTLMNYYWDTKDVQQGDYMANVVLNYFDKRTQQDLELEVRQDKINVIGVGFVISSEGGSEGNLVKILVSVIIVLILLNLLWFVFFRRKLAKSKK